jgi:nicotinamide-nucleotide amidase
VISNELFETASEVLGLCGGRALKLVTAESCTGGLIAAALTATPGSSNVLDRGYVTYSNAAKHAMALGAIEAADVDLALSVTGIAGPGGGTPQKPVGLVHIAVAHRGGKILHRECRYGNIGRGEVRRLSALAALALMKELIVQL